VANSGRLNTHSPRRGLNFAGCCAGPMQFSITGGASPQVGGTGGTWQAYRNAYDDYRGHHMFVRDGVKLFATPLFLVLIFVELTDVVFAVDSVPAVLAISRSQFIVFTSNAFAILGLRAIYFLLAGAKDSLVHLNVGLGFILAFVGMKMLLSRWVHINTYLSLAVVVAILAITVIASLRTNARVQKLEESP